SPPRVWIQHPEARGAGVYAVRAGFSIRRPRLAKAATMGIRVRRGAHALNPPEALPRREGGSDARSHAAQAFPRQLLLRFPRLRPRLSPGSPLSSPPSLRGALRRRLRRPPAAPVPGLEAGTGRPASRGARGRAQRPEDGARASGGG